MRIGIDLRTLSEGKTTGVEVYSYNLVKHLLQTDTQNQYILFYSAWKKMPAFVLADLPKNAKLVALKIPNRILNATVLFFGYPKLDKLLGDLDIFFSPRFLFTALSRNCPLVVTVHDISFLHNPSFFSFKQRLWHKIISDKGAVGRAKAVVAVSQSTKSDVVKFFKVPENKVVVIYPGLEKPSKRDSDNSVLARYALEGDYIFHLATIEPRKNALGVISAFEKLQQEKEMPIKLVIAGALGWLYSETLKRIYNSPVKNKIIFLNNLNSADKFTVYHNARCFVFPSFYEGFGFPPLEAMAAGTPVIAASNSSMVEVLEDAAFYVNPFRTDELTLAMRQLLEDNELHSALVEKGYKKAEEFTWEKAALQTLEVFKIAASPARTNSLPSREADV